MKRVFILSFIMPYAENIGLRDCSGFLQIGSHIELNQVITTNQIYILY